MKIRNLISVLSLGALALANSDTTTSSYSITDVSSFLAGYGITSGVSGAKATSLASALLSLDEEMTTSKAYSSAWSVIETAVPSSVLESMAVSGWTWQLDSTTTAVPAWATGLSDSVKKELIAEEAAQYSVESKYLATTSSSGKAAQQTLAVGGVLAAGVLGVAAML